MHRTGSCWNTAARLARNPAVRILSATLGGRRLLSYDFWRRFCQIEGVAAIKVAPFNRYQTLDVARAMVDSGRAHQIALYTGNDDNRPGFADRIPAGRRQCGFSGEDCWGSGPCGRVAPCNSSRRFRRAHRRRPNWRNPCGFGGSADANAALFDVRNHFAAVLRHENPSAARRLAGRWCLNPDEDLGPGNSKRSTGY
jgi:hypothetical protein